MMAREYQVRPSQMLGISDEYLAFCFDEAAFYLTAEAIGKDGKLNWSNLRWRGEEKKSNADFIEFVKKHKREYPYEDRI